MSFDYYIKNPIEADTFKWYNGRHFFFRVFHFAIFFLIGNQFRISIDFNYNASDGIE